MIIINDFSTLLVFIFLINIQKISVATCSDEILSEFTYWNQSLVLASFHFGMLLSLVFGNSVIKVFYKTTQSTSVLLAIWSFFCIILTFTSSLYKITAINTIFGLVSGLLMCSTLNSFHTQLKYERRVYFLMLVCAEMFGLTMGFLMYSSFFWKNTFLTIGIIGAIFAVLNLKLKTNILYLSPVFNDNSLESEREIISLRTVKDFFLYLPLWAIFIAQSSSSWTVLNYHCWVPLYFRNSFHSNHGMISNLFIGPVLFVFMTGVNVFLNDFLARFFNQHRIKQITTVTGLIISAVLTTVLIFTPSLMANYIILAFMMGFCAFNLNGSYLDHSDSSAVANSLITYLLSNSICAVSGIVNSFFNAFLITESHYRFLPIFLLSGLINVVGAIVYFVESSILNSEKSRAHLKFGQDTAEGNLTGQNEESLLPEKSLLIYP